MHNAPSVSHPVGRSVFAGRLALALWLCGGFALAGVLLHPTAAGPRTAVMTLTWIAAGLVALRGWLASPAGTLAWDGEGWTWNGNAGSISVALDLQRVLLAHWEAASGGRDSRWLWLERGARCALWDDLRRALYSRARPGDPGSAPSSAATP
jgi:hypothetical protein